MTPAKKLGLLPLVASTYFMVSGGAYGLEELVASGYTVAIVALLATPVVWSLPTALMVGELASALPEEGGYYAWVRRAMGPFWGFQEAWLSLVASIFDMAIYPTLFTLYLGRLIPWAGGGTGAFIVGATMIAGSAAWNFRGAAPVGGSSMAMGVALLAPFAVFGVLAFARPMHALPAPTGSLGSSGLFAGVVVAMWNYMGWDNASTIAGEVAHPQRAYPRAMLATVALVALTYLVPVAGAAVAGLDPAHWTTGAWVDAARQLGGPGLGVAVVAGGMISGAGMFNALLLSYSRVPMVLAEDGFLPARLAVRDGNGTPRASIAACAIAYTACLGIGFLRLVELDVLLYGASLMLEFVALVILRVREPGLARHFKVGGGVAGAALVGIGPLTLLGMVLWQSRDEKVGRLPSLALAALLAALGPLLYAAKRNPAPRAL